MTLPENTWRNLGGSKAQGWLGVGGMEKGFLGRMEEGFYLHTSVREISTSEARLRPG